MADTLLQMLIASWVFWLAIGLLVGIAIGLHIGKMKD